MGVEPGLGAADIRIDALDDPPEPARMVHLDQMRDLVRGEIVEHEGRRQDQPPRDKTRRRSRSTSPSGSLIAHRDAPDAMPSACAAARLAASRSCFASRLR